MKTRICGAEFYGKIKYKRENKNMRKITALLVVLIIFASVFVFAACEDKTPDAIADRFDNLAEEGSFDVKSGGKGDSVVFDFGKEVTFNALAIKEKGSNISSFRIYADNESEPFYGNDFIDKYRYCSFAPVTASKIRIEVLDCTEEWSLSSLEAYYVKETNSDFEIMSYIMTDTAAMLTEEQANIAKYVTDFNLFSAIYLDKDGNLRFTDFTINGQTVGGEDAIKMAVKRLREVNPSAVITATVLGNKDFEDGLAVEERYSSAMGNHTEKLINNIVALVKDCGLDGIAFDYEYPRSMKDFDIYADFLKQLKNSLPDGKQLNAALSSWNIGTFFLSKKDIECIDRIEVMAYDMFDDNGNHSTFYSACYSILKEFDDKGVPLKKVRLGIPYYSRPVNGDSYWGNYGDVADKLSPFENTFVEEYTDLDGVKHPALANYYNGRQIVYDKTCYAIDIGVGGVMLWHFGTDSFDPDLSLTMQITNAIESRS